jgi:hypothetical protein
MDDRGANIDIVFRNGLKDFEVLPPPEIWDNIHPLIKRKRKPVIFIRAAALIAVALTLSFFAYRWSRDISTGLDNTILALNEEAASSGILPSADKPFDVAGKEIIFQEKYPKPVIVSISDNAVVPEIAKAISPETAYLQETNELSLSVAKTLPGPFLSSVNSTLQSSPTKSFIISEPDLQYLPGNEIGKLTERWSIAAMASPTYYSRFNSGSSEISKQLVASEQPLVSYSGGVAFSYKLSKRVSIQSGLFFSSLGQEVDGINSFGGFQPYDDTKGDHNFEVLTTNGTIYSNNADVFLMENGPASRIMTSYTSEVFDPKKASLPYLNNTLRQNFSYLELPVVLRYKFVDKAIDLNLIGGISYNRLVNNSVYTIIDGGKYPVGTTEGLNQSSFSSSLGMGMEYSFSGNFSINLEPTFRYYLNPFDEMTSSGFHPYSFGIFSGISYKF